MPTSIQKLPIISIVVPSFNQGRYLSDTLQSIFRQDYPRLEVVVMDGGSADESVDIIRSYEQRLTYWQSQPDGGQSAAINAGMQRCNGDLVAWLNSDDFYWGDALWQVGRAYAAFPGHGLYIGNGLRYDQLQDVYSLFCRRHLALNRSALVNGLDYVLQPSTFFLRSAWQEVGGLHPSLRFCMDWDAIIRVAERYPAVLINELLAVSREYEATKTSSGKLGRALEIGQMIRSHTQLQVTPGSTYYLLETLLDVTEGVVLPKARSHIYAGMNALREQFAQHYGNSDSFPESGDPQDDTYLPLPTADIPRRGCRPGPDEASLPSISIITPSFNQAQYLWQTLESVLNQDYPKLETIVFDGGSIDGSVDMLGSYGDRLTYWVSEPDRGPAHAINKGFARATGEILGWLNSDDMLATDALWEVARAFAEDPDLDMLYANALYIDEENRLYLADHGTHRTAFYYGEMQPLKRIPAYWSYVHAVPQPTVFFRRRLLESCGPLNESYHYIFDFELFWRFVQKARKIKKLERTQAFYRIHAASKTSDWNKFLIELYHFSRPYWPPVHTNRFRNTFRGFIGSYMRRRFGARPHDIWFWGAAALVGFAVVTRIGNPEAFRLRLPAPRTSQSKVPPPPVHSGRPASAPTNYDVDQSKLRYRSLFCSYSWPRHPGYSGGEIRDFHLLRHLLSISSVEFFAADPNHPDGREDPLSPYLKALHTPDSIRRVRPDLVHSDAFNRSLKSRAASRLARRGIPVLGPRYHRDAAHKFPTIGAFCRAAIQEALKQQPDFLFVSPQTNPIGLMLATSNLPTRLILASYDVEAVRMQRIAASHQGLARIALDLEAKRAVTFERESLAVYDGVIAVSKLDKEIFVREYGLTPDRVLIIDNGVDPCYFTFTERRAAEKPQIIFVGSLTYVSNQQAAWRLIQRIMPLVWQRYPDACLSIVGQEPEPALCAQSDGQWIVVTGRVDDVRPYLANASVACVPLISGSGTKYKVLEALSAGVPVVCSPLAVEGLNLENGQHVLLGQSDAELAAAIMWLIEAPELAAGLARRGRALVERQYAWDVNLVCLDDWLAMLASLPRRNESKTPGSPSVQYASST